MRAVVGCRGCEVEEKIFALGAVQYVRKRKCRVSPSFVRGEGGRRYSQWLEAVRRSCSSCSGGRPQVSAGVGFRLGEAGAEEELLRQRTMVELLADESAILLREAVCIRAGGGSQAAGVTELYGG